MPADPYYLDPRLAAKIDEIHVKRLAMFETHGYEAVTERFKARACENMAEIDRLPREWRELVWDHGWAKVKNWMEQGKRPFDVVAASLDLSDLL